MIRILGVRVDEITMEQTVAAVERFIAAFRHHEAASEQRPAQIVTINPEGIWLARGDAAFAEAIERAALVTPDGNGVLWAARQQGTPLPERVTGIDLTYRLAEQAARQGWSVYLLGAKEGIAKAAAARLTEQYPGLTVAGIENGYFRDREQQVIEQIAAAAPDILLAALGMPFQEKWLFAHAAELNCGVAIGIGGSFDVISGQVRRAPALLQKLRLEWLWRLLADPKRWRRYLVIPRFMRAVKKQR